MCRQCQRELYYLKRNLSEQCCDINAFFLAEFCNNAQVYPGRFYEISLSQFQYIWDPKLKRFFREEKSERMLREELDICYKFLIFFEKLLTRIDFINLLGTSHNFTYSERVWLVLYAYLSYSKIPHSVKILFTMLYSSIFYTDDQILNRLRRIDHFWIYKLSIYLMKDLIDDDFDLKELIKEDIIIPLNKILSPVEENR